MDYWSEKYVKNNTRHCGKEYNIIKPSEKVGAKEVFIMVPGKNKVDLDKIKKIHLEPSIVDEIIEGTEYGEDID